MNKLILGDCLEKLQELPDNSVDSVVTDPPYGLKFMGKKWDHEVPGVDVWRECMRVLKPGGHMLVACGTRTQHRMAVNIEDAGFEIRDVVTWLYGSGFPKSLDVSKAMDKAAGAEREIVGKKSTYREPQAPNGWDCTKRAEFETAPSTDLAKQWQGWGTALKPACEFWTLARKPLEGTVAENVQEHGTGALNIDGCRVKTCDEIKSVTNNNIKGNSFASSNSGKERDTTYTQSALGRWPANLILDEVAAEMLDEQTGELKSGGYPPMGTKKLTKHCYGDYGPRGEPAFGASQGGASRFFYVAKASKAERNAGCESITAKPMNTYNFSEDGSFAENSTAKSGQQVRLDRQNHHPTVKPIKLMRYLCRLITPPGGIVLDPFMGSGSTGVAAKQEGFGFVGVEREAEYMAICQARISA